MTLSDKEKYKPTERFSGLADKYALGRPSYPREAIDLIIEHARLNEGDVIADVGCGTGISSRLFAERGLNVQGIEPNDDMRKQAMNEPFASDYPKPNYLPGCAECTGLSDNAVSTVICAQAFHWFAPHVALAEFHRILKAKGWLVLMWNERDDSDAFTKEYSQIIQTIPEAASLETKRSKSGELLLQYPTFANSQKLLFPNSQSVDEIGVLNRASSTSYAPKDENAAKRLSEKLKALFANYQKNGKVRFAYFTFVYLAQRLDP